MTDNHHTPEGADGLRQGLYRVLQRHHVAGAATDTELLDALLDDLSVLIAAERSRLLDAVEGVIGEDEPEMIGNTHMVTNATNNKLRAELRAALKGLREGEA